MIIDNVDLFSSLVEDEKKRISDFFQYYMLEKGKDLIIAGEQIRGIYFLEKGQIVVSDKSGKGLGFINPNSIIGISIIYDYSNKSKISNINLCAFLDCTFLIMPEHIIKKLTDKDKLLFSKIINQIKVERTVFNGNLVL